MKCYSAHAFSLLSSSDQSRFEFVYRLPAGVVGDKVMMQWRYVTANSCIPKGYLDPSLGLADRGWLRSPGMVVRICLLLFYEHFCFNMLKGLHLY